MAAVKGSCQDWPVPRDRSVHEVARVGFVEADAYERARPGYPPAVLAWVGEPLRLGPGAVVVDLVTGSGKLTRLLDPTRATEVAAEPLEPMRALLASLCLPCRWRPPPPSAPLRSP
jgi:hypothetical protein